MYKKKYCRVFISIFIFVCVLGFSQDLPPIVKYPPTLYGAGNQNWMISQDKNRFVYFANNDGLLEFNGSTWTLFSSPNESIIRSVKVVGDKIYSGCYMNFGYWQRQSNGQLKYYSLSDSIKSKLLDDEQFWNIINYDQWIVFQSLSRIYIYDTKTTSIKLITPNHSITKIFKTNNSIYYQVLDEGLYEIENGVSKIISNNAILKNNKIIAVYGKDDGLLIQTQLAGFFKLNTSDFTKFVTKSDSQLESSSIYSSQQLSDGSFAVGSVSNGIFILDEWGGIKYHINQTKGLSNNTALSLFEDLDKNLWIGLDNGINCINLQSPVKSYADNAGVLGTIYSSIFYNNKLYFGTNQGLFCKKVDSDNDFHFVSGTKGQVWSLFKYDGMLFCGHDSGTFIIDNEIARSIYSQSGTWKFSVVPNSKELLLQGNYNGISVLQKVNNQWIFKTAIKGFNYSSRYFEIDKKNNIYVSHEYKGVFRLKINSALDNVINSVAYKSPSKGKNASLVKFNGEIYYAFKGGIFKLNSETLKFYKDVALSSVFEKDEYTSGKIIIDETNKLWLFSKNYIHYFSLSKLSSQLKQNTIPIPASLTNSLLGFENISQISKSIYLVGTSNGYYTININDLSFKNYKVYITKVSNNILNQKINNYSITESRSFNYDENNITLDFTVPEYNKYINAEYQYLLEGFQDEWSEWSSKSTVNFKNLPSGNYVFKVRAKVANSQPENTAVYSFKISKPWYFTNFALLIYLILACFLAFYINKAYKNYYQTQREKLIEENNLLLEIKELESNQQLMRIKNEQLSQDVDTKNRELAVSTMSLIKKDELLALIKEDLKKTTDEEGSTRSLKSVITTINKNISDDKTWNVFKEAFDTADKDFLKKVKQAHQSLTPNDLRLCAYLRLNLSSKEIAPLLNISVRSIEIKRYRLRKKMELTHEQGLVEYILSF
jgi:DNA-binding CsgD family transcriptional regulator/ligand-binding sensor domain-containing protein